MTLAISSNSPSITTDYTFKTNKTATIEQNDRLNSLYTEYNDEKNFYLKKIMVVVFLLCKNLKIILPN